MKGKNAILHVYYSSYISSSSMSFWASLEMSSLASWFMSVASINSYSFALEII
jgi:hypothetical protein